MGHKHLIPRASHKRTESYDSIGIRNFTEFTEFTKFTEFTETES